MSQSISDKLGSFKAFLSLWILLAMLVGLMGGYFFTGSFQTLASIKIFSVNPIMAILVWLLILPGMVELDYSNIRNGWRKPEWQIGLQITTLTNWLVKPLLLAALAIVFFRFVFSPWLTHETAEQYIAGLILLGVAPCTGMIFVWSRLSRGDAQFTVSQVCLNNVVLLFAYAPLAGLLLGMSDISIPWGTLGFSVFAYLIIPLVSGYLIRRALLAHYRCICAIETFTRIASPITKVGLLMVVILLFGFQAKSILQQPMIVMMIATPLILQGFLVFAFAYGWAFLKHLPNSIAAPSALIGTSNFFELAVAIAITLFGVSSPAAIATTVGVLTEVPIMLCLVYFVNRHAKRMNERCTVLA